MIKISLVCENEYHEILEIEKGLFNNPMSLSEFKKFTKQKTFTIWKIETDEIIGYTTFFNLKDEIEIVKIGIKTEYQRNKFGTILLNEIKSLGIKKIFLEVAINNHNALNFYVRNGFREVGIRKKYYKLNNKYVHALRLMYEI